MVRVWSFRLALVALVSVSAGAQQPPTQFASVTVDDCGRVGALLEETSGTGTTNGVTTKFATASFELACVNEHVGQIDIQTADNQPAVVTYRTEKGRSEGESRRGPDVTALVEDAIRQVCSCGAR